MADVTMPSIIVLIVCKTISAGSPDANAAFTGHQAREWAYEHSMMVCRRHELPVIDMAAEQGADSVPFTSLQCQRSAMQLGPAWDVSHRNTPWRFWRAACPTPIRSGPKETDPIIGYTMPDCGGHRDTVRCEVDSQI